MAKRSLSEQLDQIVEAILAHPDSALPRAEAKLAPLVRIAAVLCDLPSRDFEARLKADLTRRGPMASKAITLPEGFQTASPYLCLKDTAGAIEFYKKAFGATEVMRLTQPDGRIGHAEIRIGNSPIMLSDEFPDYGALSPESLGGSPVKIHLYVEDVDALARQAVAAGAKVVRAVADQFYGDRSGQFADPFGYTWIISTRKETLAPEEMKKRFDAFVKQLGASTAQEKEATKPVKPIREGFHTITPYVMVHQAAELIEFVKQAFDGEELLRGTGSAGGIHAEVRVGDSIMMIGGGGAWRGTPMPTALHLYVDDVDAVYKRAVRAGATSVMEPADQFYGDREAYVKDMSGNHWYIATHKGASPIPEGFHNVTPYLHPRGAAQLIAFLKKAFDADEIMQAQAPDGIVKHASARIGDSMIEMGEAHGEFQPMPTAIYMYVNDADALYRRALEAGATSLWEPADQPYGDRNAGVADPFGNQWYMATHIKDVPL